MHTWLQKYGLLILFTSSLFFVIVFHFSNHQDRNQTVINFREKLSQLEKEAQTGLDSLYSATSSIASLGLFTDSSFTSSELFREKGIVYLIYDRDSLVFWSDYSAAVENYRKEVCLDNSLARLRNGWFEVIQHPGNNRNSRNYIALLLIKNEYSYQNKFLESGFPVWYRLPENADLKEYSSQSGENVILSYQKKPLFLLDLPADSEINHPSFWPMIFYLVVIISGFLCLFQFLSIMLKDKSKGVLFFVFISVIFFLRTAMIYLEFPRFLYHTFLFDPTLYADSSSVFFGRLGDIFIHSVLLLYLIFFLIKSVPKFNFPIFVYYLFFTLLALFSSGLNSLISGIVLNSHISFRLNEIFSLSPATFVALLSIGFIFLSFYLLARFVLQFALQNGLKVIVLYIFFSVGLLSHLLMMYFIGGVHSLPEVWAWGLFLLLLLFRNADWRNSFSYALPFILFFSSVSAYLFLSREKQKELEIRKIYVQDLNSQRDDVAENLFVDVSAKIRNDKKLKNIIFSPPVNSIDLEQRLRQQYFSGYWEKFNVILSVVDSSCIPLLRTENPFHGNNSYFDQQIEQNGVTTVADGLYFIDDKNKSSRYVARLKVEFAAEKKMKPAVVYAELSRKITDDVSGFPELLLDKRVNTNSKLKDYSYAIYTQKKLARKSGKFNYNQTFDWEFNGNFSFINKGGFSHLVFTSGISAVVMSLPENGWKDKLSQFSGFFSFFSFLLILLFLFREIFSQEKYYRSSLNFRIQILLISVVLFALLFFGWSTYFVMKRQFDNQNLEALNQLSRSVTEDVQLKLAAADELNENYSDYVGYLFRKVSNVFSSDVSLFDLRGNLIASSQPRLFEEGIISRKMNPRAFADSLLFSGPRIILDENIGELNFYSSYQRFFNREGKHIGYIHLPYFAKKEQQEKEISLSVAAWVNIYVVLFAVSVIVALLISNWVTKPLRVLQQRFSVVRFGSKNEMIEWKGSDEISALVKEYNRMVTQLEESANLLAKSEREGAWREMAKQVAHEIKNPLTPMKLNIQHLLRTLDTGNPDELKDRVRKLSQMLVEQIDALSTIASEFSSFAQMPQSNFVMINISDVLNHVLQLFSAEENHTISKVDTTDGHVMIWVDKDQCVRVFTNLLKNAVQSVPEGRAGNIQVEINDNGLWAEVKIKDNGSGIPYTLKDRIFTPNFSTKTGGMGLGLAIVKNIIESFRGSISFETVQDVGTTFVVHIPKVESGSV